MNQNPETPILTVINETVDSGTVTSQPGGIDCSVDCDEAYPKGTSVTLTASADNGSVFTGWQGACSGNAPTCEVSIEMNRSVTATFEPEDPGTTSPDTEGNGGNGTGSGGGGCFLSTVLGKP